MWYDKQKDAFYHEKRDVVDVVAKLRYLAVRVEQQNLGCLSLNDIGDIFGNEFWELIYPPPVSCPTCRRP